LEPVLEIKEPNVMAEVEVPLTDGVNVPLIETVALGVDDAESVDDGLIELVAVSEFVVLWELVPDPEILDVCDAVSVVVSEGVSEAVADREGVSLSGTPADVLDEGVASGVSMVLAEGVGEAIGVLEGVAKSLGDALGESDTLDDGVSDGVALIMLAPGESVAVGV
jgi:hypothetical protein